MTETQKMLARADRHLSASCPHMKDLVRRVGPCGLQTQPDGFQMLVRSITAQQISSAAARSIGRRLRNRLPSAEVTPEAVRSLGGAAMRSCGYSARKASYILGLADAVLDGGLDLAAMRHLPDKEVIARLTVVRGIGVWTAKMFLIFSLGRPDVLPHEDLGVRQALRNFHGLNELPGRPEAIRLARPWRPYASVASWYCWRSLDPQFAAGDQ